MCHYYQLTTDYFIKKKMLLIHCGQRRKPYCLGTMQTSMDKEFVFFGFVSVTFNTKFNADIHVCGEFIVKKYIGEFSRFSNVAKT